MIAQGIPTCGCHCCETVGGWAFTIVWNDTHYYASQVVSTSGGAISPIRTSLHVDAMCRLLSISNVANICVLLVSSFLDRFEHGDLSLHPTVVARKPQQYEPQAQLTLFAAALHEAPVPYIR